VLPGSLARDRRSQRISVTTLPDGIDDDRGVVELRDVTRRQPGGMLWLSRNRLSGS